MAEREGFEPSVSLLDLLAISSRAPSAARASLRVGSCQQLAVSGQQQLTQRLIPGKNHFCRVTILI
jgi:hypothetical protein